MASLCRKRGASGALSPYWQAILSFNHRKIWISTKCVDRRIAKSVSECWTKACWLGQRWELNQQRCDRLLAEIQGRTKCPATLDNSRQLFKRLMAESTGEVYAGENFANYCQEWLEARKATLTKGTFGKYEAIVGGFIESLQQRRRSTSVASIGAPEVRKWRDGLISSGISQSTANVHSAVVTALFNDARRQGIVVVNPAEAVQKLAAHDIDERLAFSEEQVRALLQKADVEWRGMILFGVHAGLRLSDSANLRWNSVDLVNRTLSYQAQKTAHRKKKKSERTTVVYLHADLVSFLESVVPSADKDVALFPSLAGLGTSGSHGLSKRFADIMKKARIVAPVGREKSGKGRQFRSLSFHSLRHSFCSRLANAEIAMEIRKQMSGHSSDQVHEGYSHLSIELQKSAIGKLPSVL